MKIESLKDLNKLITLCRKQGIQSIKIDNIELEIGPVPHKEARKRASLPVYAPGGVTDEIKIPSDMPSYEEMLMWSAVSNGEDQNYITNES